VRKQMSFENSIHGNWGFGFCNWGFGFPS